MCQQWVSLGKRGLVSFPGSGYVQPQWRDMLGVKLLLTTSGECQFVQNGTTCLLAGASWKDRVTRFHRTSAGLQLFSMPMAKPNSKCSLGDLKGIWQTAVCSMILVDHCEIIGKGSSPSGPTTMELLLQRGSPDCIPALCFLLEGRRKWSYLRQSFNAPPS